MTTLTKRLLARLYPKLRTRFSLSGKNPGFLANTFSTSQIIDEVKKVKLPFHRGFSDSDRVTKKMDKVEVRQQILSQVKVAFAQ